MFGRMMNNYYYGKSGKGDFRKEDLPTTRMELFRQTLRTRFGALIRLNLLYVLIWLPAMFCIYRFCALTYSTVNNMNVYSVSYEEYADWAQKNEYEVLSQADFSNQKTTVALMTRDYDLYTQTHPEATREQFSAAAGKTGSYQDMMNNTILLYLLYLIPCIAITGPFTAGVSYVTRNWARDEHAFIWSDFKDAVKQNWKIPLVISCITSILPVAVFEAWRFYGELAQSNVLMTFPQVLVPIAAAFWAISVTYMHPMTVTYDLKLKHVLMNSFRFGEFRLPFSVGIRLLHCVPLVLFFLAQFLFNLDMMIAVVILGVYYILIGFSLSRFITASYTNAVFDRFMNSKIEGAKVNQGMRPPMDEDDEEDENISQDADSSETDHTEDGKE